MKKYLIYSVLLVSGIILGGFIFSGSKGDSANSQTNTSAESKTHASDHDEFWTCSMHPQIMKNESGDCPICGMELVPAKNGNQELSDNEIQMTENAMALANIQTHVVARNGSSNSSYSLSGKIRQNEEKIAIQASYYDGRIERLAINYAGQEVQKGDLLARIYAPELVAAQQELITAAGMKAEQPALYKAVYSKLKAWKLSDKQINAIETSGEVQQNFPIYATQGGTVEEVMSAEGDYVKRGSPLLKLSQLNEVWASFDAYENEIGSLQEGQPITIKVAAYPGKSYQAKITFIEPTLNQDTRTIRIRAVLPNPKNMLKPGMFITGEVAKDLSEQEQLKIPASSVLWTGERSLVYVKTDQDKPVFEMREVSLGDRLGDQYVITAGLNTGEQVVTHGAFTVDAAAQLQDKRSMMNKRGEERKAQPELNLTAEFQKELQQVLSSYWPLKDAFIASNAEVVSKNARVVDSALRKLNTGNLDEELSHHLNNLGSSIRAIASAEVLSTQRSDFVIFNSHLVKLVEAFQKSNPSFYIQKCPMANNNKGAFWLSKIEQIENPYYGSEMLNCGSIIDTIPQA